MKEADWLESSDPIRMLLHLRLKKRPAPSSRKLRLLACAFVRHVVDFFPDERVRQAVAGVESFCEDPADVGRLRAARHAVLELQNQLALLALRLVARWHGEPDEDLAWLWSTLGLAELKQRLRRVDPALRKQILVTKALRTLTTYFAGPTDADQKSCGRMARFVAEFAALAASERDERRFQVATIREVFGNAFRPGAIDPAWRSWRDQTVVRLAQAAYDDPELPAGRLDVTKVQVLADALEEAGCTDPAILGHLRQQDTPHVRGCWVVDTILNKE